MGTADIFDLHRGLGHPARVREFHIDAKRRLRENRAIDPAGAAQKLETAPSSDCIQAPKGQQWADEKRQKVDAAKQPNCEQGSNYQ
jgi:hypothetical protein